MMEQREPSKRLNKVRAAQIDFSGFPQFCGKQGLVGRKVCEVTKKLT